MSLHCQKINLDEFNCLVACNLIFFLFFYRNDCTRNRVLASRITFTGCNEQKSNESWPPSCSRRDCTRYWRDYAYLAREESIETEQAIELHCVYVFVLTKALG